MVEGVCFAWCGWRVRIFHSVNIVADFHRMQRENSQPVYIVAILPTTTATAFADEHNAKMHFQHKRIDHEWYNITIDEAYGYTYAIVQ